MWACTSASDGQVRQIALKEEGARLACGARRLKGKVACLAAAQRHALSLAQRL